jgi:4-hydroxybenzoate polyprenyltransferase
MDLVTRLFQPPWGASAFSAVVALATGVAILAFNAPSVVLIPVAWATVTAYATLKPHIERRLDQQ